MAVSAFVRRLGWSFLHQGVGRGAVFVFFALLPMWVSLEAAGTFVLAYSAMQVVLQPAFDTAVGTMLARSAAQSDRRAVRQLLYWALLLLGVMLSGGLALVSVWRGFAPIWVWLAAYFALQLPLNMAFAVCRGSGRFDIEGVVGSLQKVALVPLFALMPPTGSAPAQAMLFSALAGWTLFAVFFGSTLLGAVRRRDEPATPSLAGAPLRETLVLTALATVALLYLRIDLVLLDAFSGARDVGIYSTASRWIEASFALPFVFMLVMFPQLSSRPLQRADVGRAIRLFAAVGIATFAASLVAAWLIVPVAYGDTVGREISSLLIQLSPCAIAVSFGMLFSQTLVAWGRTLLALTAAIVGLVTKVTIAAIAIPRMGPAGAALAAVATEAAVALAAGVLLWRVMDASPAGLTLDSPIDTNAPGSL